MNFTNRKRAGFTQILNAALYDTRLRFSDKGLLTTMLSFPDDWEYHVTHLQTLGPDGRDAVYGMLKRLESAGYVRKIVSRKEKGKFDGVDYEVSDEPIVTSTANGFPVSGLPASGKPTTSNTQSNNTQEDKRLAETPPAPQLSLFPGEPDLEQIEQQQQTEAWEGKGQQEDSNSDAEEPQTPRNSGLKRVEDTEATPLPSSASVPKEMTAENTRKQAFAIEASQRKQYIKTLKEILGEKYFVADTLIKKHGMKPEKILQRFQSQPALLTRYLSLDHDPLWAILLVAVESAEKHTVGYQSNVGWQFFDWLTKGRHTNAPQEAPGKPTPYVIKYTDPDWREKHEAYTRAFEEWQEKNRR